MLFKGNRAHGRYPFLAKAKITMKGAVKPSVITTLINNISEAGLSVSSHEPVKLGAEISMNIEYVGAKGGKEHDTVDGNVVWRCPKGNIYYLGIFFSQELNPHKQPKLYRHFRQAINPH